MTNDGMVHIGDYGFAYLWEIQQLKPGVGGSESMIDSQDTLSTYVGTNERVLPVTAANKEMLPICDHMTNRVKPISTNKETVTLCEHGNERLVPKSSADKDMLPMSDFSTEGMLQHNKEMIPMYNSYQGQTIPVTYKDSHVHTCDTAMT